MLDRRDFDEWWERERIRNGGHDLGADAKHWAEKGYFAAQATLRNHVRNQQGQTRKTTAALLGGAHVR